MIFLCKRFHVFRPLNKKVINKNRKFVRLLVVQDERLSNDQGKINSLLVFSNILPGQHLHMAATFAGVNIISSKLILTLYSYHETISDVST